MTKIGVVSDSHGSQLFLKEAAHLLKTCDVVYHLGDFAEDADYLRGLGIRVVSVPGNCDGYTGESDDRIVVIDGIRIFMTHGHKYGVKFSKLRLKLTAQQEACQIALYGHTHIQDIASDDGVILLNPGALKSGKYAMIVIDDTGIHKELCKIELE